MTKLDWKGPVTKMDDDEEFETLDEAIAAALDQVGDGGLVRIHDEDCKSPDGERGCTCEPLELTKGASA